MKHYNVALFIPHNGCPNQCSFCNQRSITGSSIQPSATDVLNSIEIAIKSLGDKTKEAEIAFFGGSFTAIDGNYMKELLEAAFPYIKNGIFKGIRISTRPDAIDDSTLDTLKSYGVTSIELGAQSMDDDVLLLNRRGHTSTDVFKASRLIKDYGFSLGLQMMTGLYSSTVDKDYRTGEIIAQIKPDTVRIYPTIVMKGTYLAKLYELGQYVPYSFDETVKLCSRLLDLFENNNVEVIRLGLHDTPSLHNGMIAGTWHPAFREICESTIMLNKCIDTLNSMDITTKDLEIRVNPRSVSKMIGQKKSNIEKLKNMGYSSVKVSEDESIKVNDLIIGSCG